MKIKIKFELLFSHPFSPPNQTSPDCRIIHARGPSHEPNNNYSHASVVTHLYYTANNKLTHTYDFMQRGLVISQDTRKLENFPFCH